MDVPDLVEDIQSSSIKPERRRRSHKKSRYGCRNCKLRRVKCDEARPHCRKCRGYGVLCNYDFNVPDMQVISIATGSDSSGSQNAIHGHHGRRVQTRKNLRLSGTLSSVSSVSVLPLCRPLNAGVLDCFPALFPGINRNSANLYFYHYRYCTSGAMFPFGSDGMTTWLWQMALDQPILGHMMLSTSATHQAARLSNPVHAGPDSLQIVRNSISDSLVLRSQAIQSIQKMPTVSAVGYLESIVLLVCHLIGIEAAEANTEAVEVHVQGLKKLVAAIGGLERLSDQTILIIYGSTFMIGLLKVSQSIFRVSRQWKLRVLQQASCMKEAINRSGTTLVSLGTRFFNSSWSMHIHPSLRLILQSFQQIIACHETVDSTSHERVPLASDTLLVLSVHQLLSLTDEECSPTRDPVQDALRQSILVYAALRIWAFRGLPCISCIVDALQQGLERSLPVFQVMAPDLLFWVLFMGGLGSQGLESDCHAWFITHLADVAEQLSLRDWDHALSLLEEFFFVYRPISDEPVKRLWDSVCQSRSQSRSRSHAQELALVTDTESTD